MSCILMLLTQSQPRKPIVVIKYVIRQHLISLQVKQGEHLQTESIKYVSAVIIYLISKLLLESDIQVAYFFLFAMKS